MNSEPPLKKDLLINWCHLVYHGKKQAFPKKQAALYSQLPMSSSKQSERNSLWKNQQKTQSLLFQI